MAGNATTAPNPDVDRILSMATGVLVVASVVVWAAHQVTALLWFGEWIHLTVWEGPLLLWSLLTQPSDPLATYGDGGAASPIAFYFTLGLVSLVTILVVVGLWRLSNKLDAPDRPESAEWAKPRDLKPLLVRRPSPGRLTLGTVNRRLVATEAQHSVAIIGPSGTGKTTGFAIPALLEWDGPVIATSIKGDIVEATAQRRRSRGDVWVYDPTGSTGYAPTGWSPLTTAADWQGALRMAAWLVSTAKAADRGGLQDSDFWYAVSQKLLAPLLHAAATSEHTIRDVVRWVDLQDQEQPLRALQRAMAIDAIQAFTATINREEKARSSAYTTTETVLAAFADPSVLTTTNAPPSFTPEQLLDGGNHTVYISGPVHEQARLRPLFTAVIEETVHAVYQRANQANTRLQKPLLLVIDEAANIAPLPDLAQLASTARGVGIQLVTVWQDFAQLQSRYGTLAQTVINNHRAKIVLSGVSDTPTLDYTSRLIGDQAITETSKTTGPDGTTKTTTETIRYQPLATPAQLRQQPTGEGVLIYGNLAPAQLKLRRHDVTSPGEPAGRRPC